jgi:hypothetical protein
VANALLVDVHGDARIDLTPAPVSSGLSCLANAGAAICYGRVARTACRRRRRGRGRGRRYHY